MATEREVRPGTRVIGQHGGKLGTVGSVRRDPASGLVSAFTVKHGFFIFSKEKLLSINVVRQVNNDTNTVDVNIGKSEFRGLPDLETG